MVLETLTAYLVFPMMVWSPPVNHLYVGETNDYVEARYFEIANDLAKVVIEEEPLDVWNEPKDVRRVHTAVLMLAIASFESGGFRSDVDKGKTKGDRGHSKCLMQIWLRDNEKIDNRKECFRLGLDRIKESMNACKYRPVSERLAVYASGKCDVGVAEGKHRYDRMQSWWNTAPWYGDFAAE
jgi:hypothetical protein